MPTRLSEKELYQKINELLISEHADSNPIFYNLKLLHSFSDALSNNLSVFDETKFEEEYQDKATFKEIVELIKRFYQEQGIKFDIDRCINDGTLDITFCEKIDSSLQGRCNYVDGHESVFFMTTNQLTDSAILVHELSHLRDQSSDHWMVQHLLTEAIAFAEELIFLDFLSRNGHEADAKKLIINELGSCYYASKIGKIAFSMVDIFNEFGSITEKDYNLIYKNNPTFASDFNKLLANHEVFIGDFDQLSTYTLGYALAFYMYHEYKKDSKFMGKIQQLHVDVNRQSFTDCLSVIGLSTLIDEERDIIIESINQIVSDLGISKIANVS